MSDDVTTRKATVLPLELTPNGDFRGLMLDEQGVRPAEFRKMKEGSPIIDECVTFQAREGSPLLEAQFTRVGNRSGPAQVTTPAYAAGWERIFAKNQVGEA